MSDKRTRDNTFASLVASFRQRRGLSQGQLAQAARLSRTYVYHLETGQRSNPSPQVVQNIARVLELNPLDQNLFYKEYHALTGQFVDPEQVENTLLDLGELASLLVHNTSYPAHALDKMWYLYASNMASVHLFEVEELLSLHDHMHLLEMVFDPALRARLHGWENLARRLVSDFQYNTRTLTHLPEFKELWRTLRESTEFRRISSSIYPRGRPVASFTFQIQHSCLGRLTLRTATTVFSGSSGYSMVSYAPGDLQTLTIFRTQGWQSPP